MFQFDVEQHVPSFLLSDKNGFALAMAIKAAMQYANDRAEFGIRCILDYDKMPEWRLDEIAWEYNCLYDYGADIETKRKWIKNAVPLYRMFGTVQAIYKYVGSYFSGMDVEENWQYGGEPFHFRVTVEGAWTPETERWVRKAVGEAQNVRSALDSLRLGHKCFIGVMGEGQVLGRFRYPMTGPEMLAGLWPEVNTLGQMDDTGKASLEAGVSGWKFPYPVTGTRPDISTIARVDESGGAGIRADAVGNRFLYRMTNVGTLAGKWPQENNLGVTGKSDISAAKAEDTYAEIFYKMCGADEL